MEAAVEGAGIHLSSIAADLKELRPNVTPGQPNLVQHVLNKKRLSSEQTRTLLAHENTCARTFMLEALVSERAGQRLSPSALADYSSEVLNCLSQRSPALLVAAIRVARRLPTEHPSVCRPTLAAALVACASFADFRVRGEAVKTLGEAGDLRRAASTPKTVDALIQMSAKVPIL